MSTPGDHARAIVEQFTLQAVPFARMPAHSRTEAMRLYQEMSGVSADDTVLDVACGPGLTACEFAAVARNVTGIDITPAMIGQATCLQVEKGLTNLAWRVGDVSPLPFADGSFTLVFTRFSFHHFTDPAEVLSEMLRVCAPGGMVMVVDVALPADKVDAYNRLERLRDPSHTRALTVDEFGVLAHGAGLHDIRSAFHTVELELEAQLAASFPHAGDDEKVRRIIRDDLGRDDLGVGVHLKEGQYWYACPILVMAGRK